MSEQPKIAVLGSINMDLVVRCGKLPTPGETVIASQSMEICGGKGANQAVAAAKSGGQVRMIGRVGDDIFGETLKKRLEKEGVDCTHVQMTNNCASGLAVVAVEGSGENSILVVPGANAKLSKDDVESARATIESSDALLVQLEIPVPTVIAAMDIARKADVKVILDPAPVPAFFPSDLFDVDLVCPNETEAIRLMGMRVDDLDSAKSAAFSLQGIGAKHVAITRGAKGTALLERSDFIDIQSFKVETVDTTAAGDAFAGALSVRWSEGEPLKEAVRFANAAGALAVSRMGAQPGMATREEILGLLKGG